MGKMTVEDIEVRDKRVLLRVDFNVPLDEKTGEITDDNRIRASLPTIKYLTEHGAKVILMSHLGRPKGKVVDGLRLGVVARRLSQILGRSAGIAPNCVGPEVERMVANLKSGDILLLENLRFHPEEEAGDVSFAQALARLGDLFVNDAFGVAHRAHASISIITNYLPAVAGFRPPLCFAARWRQDKRQGEHVTKHYGEGGCGTHWWRYGGNLLESPGL